VKKILGEPHHVAGGTIAQWFYQNNGMVIFHEGKAYQWMEPGE
jgi:hypothetical protein